MTRPFCTRWQNQGKEFFPQLHGHQRKTLALFVFGAIAAKSLTLPLGAEAWLAESDAKASRSERRRERFFRNERMETEPTGDALLAQVLSLFRKNPLRLVREVTPAEEHAPVMSPGLLSHSRVFPLAWKGMPGWQRWEPGLWACVEALITRVVPQVGDADGPLMGESAFGCVPLMPLCQKESWHALVRIGAHQTCQPRAPDGYLEHARRVSDRVNKPGKRFSGRVRFWQEEALETKLRASGDPQEEEALRVISDRPAGGARLRAYRLRWRVEATFHDRKRRGWQWESGPVRRLDRIDRMLLVLVLAIGWRVPVAASCRHHGKRDRSDRHDRRDTSIFRIGRLSLFELARTSPRLCERKTGFVLRGSPTTWRFSLRF